MTRLEQIVRAIRRQNAEIRLFLRYAHRAGIRPFFGKKRPTRDYDYVDHQILVSPDLVKKGVWRVTWFDKDGPGGHSEYKSFDEAVKDAVKDFGLNLDTVQFHAERDRSRRPRRKSRRR